LSYTRFIVSRAKAAKLPPYILDVLQLPTSNRTAPRFFVPRYPESFALIWNNVNSARIMT